MRKFYTTTALALACAAALALNAACKSGDSAGAGRVSSTNAPTTSTPATTNGNAAATPHPTSTPGDNVRRITVADSRQAADKGEAVIVDVRPKAQYEQSHIKGSLSIPKNELPNRLAELPKDKLIIFYCA